MSQSENIEQMVNSRFNTLFVDVKKAAIDLSNKGKPVQDVVEIEQSLTKRSLLRVEKKAIREKDLNKKLEQSYINGIRDSVHIELEKRLLVQLHDVDFLYKKVVGIDEGMPALLDGMNVRAATISKLEPLAADVPWYYQEIVKMANLPKYRRKDKNGKLMLVDTLRAALGFFGIENLLPITLALALKRWLPQITDPYPDIKNRIREEAMGVAITAKHLAPFYKTNPDHAFAAGMLLSLGKIAVVRLYFRLFDTVQREALIEAQKAQKHEEHLGLMRIQACGDFVAQLCETYAPSISAQLVQKMGMRRVFVANALEDVADKIPFADMSDLAQTLVQAQGYAKYRMLKAHRLIEFEESKEYIMSLKLPAGALQQLKTVDIRSLDLQMGSK